MKSILFVSVCASMFACASQVDDDSMYLTGSEEYAIQNEDGSFSCENPKKVLICHIPPGNPDNAHTICVGEPAVDPHQRLHGDTIGACDDDGEDAPDGGVDLPEADAGVDVPEADAGAAVPDAATPDIDAGAVTPDAAVIDGGTGGVD